MTEPATSEGISPDPRGEVPDQPLIAARGLFAGYGRVTIVRDLNLEVFRGEVVTDDDQHRSVGAAAAGYLRRR